MTGSGPTKRRLFPAALAAAVAVAGIALAQNSAAFWNAQETTSGVTVTAGTAELTVTALDRADDGALFPGGTIQYVGGTLAATGDVPLSVSVSRDAADEFAAAMELTVGIASPEGECIPTQIVPLTGSASLGDHAPGDVVQLCASVTLPTDATVGAGLTSSLTLTFSGTQS